MAKVVPDKNYRFDPNRAIYVNGALDQALLDRLTPSIMRLTSESREPISVFIDSPGGFPQVGDALLRLLRSRGQENLDPCRLITVVTSMAASAAADLLAAGDYSIALAGSRVYFHGNRHTNPKEITFEAASGLVQNLRTSNQRAAHELVERAEKRWFFRFVTMRSEFAQVREESANKELSDSICFVKVLHARMSQSGRAVLRGAAARNERYQTLNSIIFSSRRISEAPAKKRDWVTIESMILKLIIDYELKSFKKEKKKGKVVGWNFEKRGLNQLNEDFLLFSAQLGQHGADRIEYLFHHWGRHILSPEDFNEIQSESEEGRKLKLRMQKFDPIVIPVWLLFVALCHSLQEGENDLSAADAFYLGMIDEVLEEPNAYSLRLLAEYEA
jgi:ATP-dependent protease ClpP protease subunit